jgi:hypothetical protein
MPEGGAVVYLRRSDGLQLKRLGRDKLLFPGLSRSGVPSRKEHPGMKCKRPETDVSDTQKDNTFVDMQMVLGETAHCHAQ